MAATVSSVWAKPGAWALDSEEHEDELTQQIMPQPTKPDPPAADFPSLAAAAAAKPKKKNKGQTLSLAEFSTFGSAPKPKPKAFAVPQRLTQDEMLVLPTGPRERTAEELERPRLGGGFRNYGGGNDNSRVRVSDRSSSRDRDMGPSRADEADDWSKAKKFSSFGGGAPERSDRREKVGFFNSSRADEVDNWASSKSFVAAPVDGPRRERRMGFESYSNGSGSDSGNWSKSKEERGGNVGGGGVESDTWGRRESVGAGGGGSGRPRLNLQPRTLPVVSVDNGVQNVTPTEAAKAVNSGLSFTPTEKVKGANPFGEARPREEVLAEKGKDWKEIDEKLGAVKINGEKSEGFRKRGFGLRRSDSGDDVKSWRKPESADAVTSPPGSSVDTTENNATTAESTAESAAESAEKVAEEN